MLANMDFLNMCHLIHVIQYCKIFQIKKLKEFIYHLILQVTF